jgi:hypothetical protein
VTIGIGIFFVLPGVAWFLTQRWWDREERASVRTINQVCELKSE